MPGLLQTKCHECPDMPPVRPLRALDSGETTSGWEDSIVAAATRYEYRVAAHNRGQPPAVDRDYPQ